MITTEDIKTANTAFDSIPFENLIGAPLCACVNAQKQAAEATMNYIQELGFDKSKNSDDLSVIMVSFEFIQEGRTKKMKLPLLSIVPVPYLQIDTVDIKFTAEVAANSDDTFNARISNQRYEGEGQSNNSLDYKGLIDLNIRATGTSMPAGLAKILQVFQDYCFEIEENPTINYYYLRVTGMKSSLSKNKITNIAKEVKSKRTDLTEAFIRNIITNTGVLCTNLTLREAEEINDMLENEDVKARIEEMASAYYVRFTGEASAENISKLTSLIKKERPDLKEEEIIAALQSKDVLCKYLTSDEAESLKAIILEAGEKVEMGLQTNN